MMNMTVQAMKECIVEVRYMYDFDYFAKEQLKIVDKNGDRIPFTQNKAQRMFDAVVDSQVSRGKPVRVCLLKARQWGGSTKWQAHLFRDSMLRPLRSSMTIAHDLDSARHLREMSEGFYVNYNWKKPTRKKESEKWWKFQHMLDGKPADSHYRIDTAEEISTGHSLTLHNLHCSEIQSWRNAAELVKGLFPTVPKSSDTMILMEGTGSGVGDYWYEFCNMARTNETDWHFLFIPWFDIEDYVQDFDSGKAKADFEKSLDSEEKNLLEIGATLEGLHWRRNEIQSKYRGDLDSFNQQYPSDPDIAFLTSGRPVFQAKTVRKRMLEARNGKKGALEWKGSDKKHVVFIEGDGDWEVFEEPHLGVRNLYASGADHSEGKAIIPELGNKGSDFSGARFFRRDTRTFVATYHARKDPDVVAEEYWKGTIYYGGSQAVGFLPEQNAQGGGELIIRRLKTVDVWLIKTPVFGKAQDQKKDDEYGWETMQNTKRLAIDTMNEAIREGQYKDPDKQVWYECSTYIYDEKGKTNAVRGKFDDLVMATALTLQADLLMPMTFKPVTEKKVKVARDVDKRRVEGKVSQSQVMEDNLVAF